MVQSNVREFCQVKDGKQKIFFVTTFVNKFHDKKKCFIACVLICSVLGKKTKTKKTHVSISGSLKLSISILVIRNYMQPCQGLQTRHWKIANADFSNRDVLISFANMKETC